ncbi:sterol desaturase family protein [Mucilaginibacter sp. OK098]|uniref:sterol desaturase family protein n=1 Tax=Mucilaginibacter sp. OK098 TaxID=1855297 RepID=UPI00091172EF|nr:sterol desaturase family protein [Mucilaginibacter sp. OK098]SHM93843.1 Fatty acid hydroxylase superfamily protein [Mucilaginibacter sp. OK098]
MNANQRKKYISNSQESVRMFKSDFFEALSKVHYTVPIIIFMPVIVYMIIQGIQQGLCTWQYPVTIISGLIVWTIVEYVLHRYIFHYQFPGKIGARLHFVIHGVHHDYPCDRRRLVMPPSLSIPLALMFFFLFRNLLPAKYLDIIFAKFLTGYLIYDIGHYAMHHLNFKSGLFKKIKQHHMLHHYQNPNRGYGVSSPLWDKILQSD